MTKHTVAHPFLKSEIFNTFFLLLFFHSFRSAELKFDYECVFEEN